MSLVIYPVLAVVILGLVIACPSDRRGRGRHISRRISRRTRFDAYGVAGIQTAWIIAEAVAAIVVAENVAVLAAMILLVSWLLDDLLTGGSDDDPKRKHEWARPRLKMPKPVKLRPVERVTSPVPA